MNEQEKLLKTIRYVIYIIVGIPILWLLLCLIAGIISMLFH